MPTTILSLLVLMSVVLLLRAEFANARSQIYIFKPLTTILIMLVALTAAEPRGAFYQYAIVVGLVFSLAGDILLVLPSDRFIPGLVSFLLAQIAYIVAFVPGTQWLSTFWSPLPFVVYAVVLLSVLLPHTGKMRAPVLMYGVVIVTMAWRAGERWLQLPGSSTLFAFVGAALFVLSDSSLAVNRFVTKYRGERLITLGLYYAAQWLIALSVSN